MKQQTIYYDNDCNLCNGFVTWIQARDKQKIFTFKALQNSKSSCPVDLDSNPKNWTVILEDNKGTTQSSDAVLKILISLGGFYRLAVIFKIIPRILRDSIYSQIASRRS